MQSIAIETILIYIRTNINTNLNLKLMRLKKLLKFEKAFIFISILIFLSQCKAVAQKPAINETEFRDQGVCLLAG